jgi:hypothetical protein
MANNLEDLIKVEFVTHKKFNCGFVPRIYYKVILIHTCHNEREPFQRMVLFVE